MTAVGLEAMWLLHLYARLVIGQDGNLTTTAAAFAEANAIDARFEHREGVLYGEGGFTSVDEEFAHGVEASGDGTIDFDVHDEMVLNVFE